MQVWNNPSVESGVIFLFSLFCLYNGSMMNDNYNTPNSGCCGRPFPTAPANKCNYNNCCMNEYKYTMPACIRNKQPDCAAQAVIPSVTVETVDGLTNLANCFVHVTSINTTYYVDDKHRPMMVWAGGVEVQAPTNITTSEEFFEFVESFKLKSQFLYVKFYNETDNKNMVDSFYFDKTGRMYFAGEFEEVTEV